MNQCMFSMYVYVLICLELYLFSIWLGYLFVLYVFIKKGADVLSRIAFTLRKHSMVSRGGVGNMA